MLKAKKEPKKKHSKAKHSKPKSKTTMYKALPANSNVQSSSVPIAQQSISGGGIPYLSSLETTFGITNKPPYYLESLIAKSTPTTYLIPKQTPSTTTISGSNNLINGKTDFSKDQSKSESVEYVDLVSPMKSQNAETQPDYIKLNDDIKLPETKKESFVEDDDDEPTLVITDKTRRKRRTKKEITEMKQMKGEDKNVNSNVRSVKEIKQSIEKRIEENKKPSKIPRKKLRGSKTNDEL